MHADVAEVSQMYILVASKLYDRPRRSLSTIESVVPKRHPEDLLHAFLKLPFSPRQVSDVVASISGMSES